MRFLRLITSIHRLSLKQRSIFSFRKCQIRISRMFLSLEVSFSENNFRNFFHVGGPPYCVIALTIRYPCRDIPFLLKELDLLTVIKKFDVIKKNSISCLYTPTN